MTVSQISKIAVGLRYVRKARNSGEQERVELRVTDSAQCECEFVFLAEQVIRLDRQFVVVIRVRGLERSFTRGRGRKQTCGDVLLRNRIELVGIDDRAGCTGRIGLKERIVLQEGGDAGICIGAVSRCSSV